MNVRTYAYGGIAFVAALCGVIAFAFYHMGFVGIAPFVLAIVIVAAAVAGFLTSLPKDSRKPKKQKKQKSSKKEPESPEE